MQYTWTIECEFQLFILIPFFVIFYNRFPKIFITFSFLALISGVIINYFIAKNYNLTAGIFSLDNYYLFSMFMNKPYCKIHVYFLGILSSVFFINISDYKV